MNEHIYTLQDATGGTHTLQITDDQVLLDDHAVTLQAGSGQVLFSARSGQAIHCLPSALWEAIAGANVAPSTTEAGALLADSLSRWNADYRAVSQRHSLGAWLASGSARWGHGPAAHRAQRGAGRLVRAMNSNERRWFRSIMRGGGTMHIAPTPATTIENPFWEEIKTHVGRGILWDAGPTVSWLGMDYRHRGFDPKLRLDRFEFCCKYSWAVPDPDSVSFVAQYLAPKAVEMGAGTGYWAWMLAQLGIDVIAYDNAPPDKVFTNAWHSPYVPGTYRFSHQAMPTYYPVREAHTSKLQEHPDRALFLCWPPYGDPMAAECLQSYQGCRLVFIGEGEGGCTGDDTFFEILRAEWHEVAEHRIVQWDAIHDYIWVYER